MRSSIIKFLREEERLSICRHEHPFTGLISVCRDDGVCCVFTLSLNLALFNLKVAINKRALNVLSYTATMESLHYLCFWSVITLVCCTRDFETEQVLLECGGEFWFLLVLWTSRNVLFNTSMGDHSGGIYLGMNVSGDAFLSAVSTPSCSSGERCWTLVLWTQQSNFRERTTMWIWSVVATRQTTVCVVGHNEALDRTMSAMSKILLDPVNGEANVRHRWPVRQS